MAFLDETGLAELWSLVKAEDAKDAKIATGSYTGTGTGGSSNPCSLTFDFVPKVLFVTYNKIPSIAVIVAGALGFCFYNINDRSSEQNVVRYVSTINGTTVSWYHTEGNNYQLNDSEKIYQYVAIG